ncbi:MAG: hypothetical protein P8X74_17150 [Reinekea sp.]
MVILPGHGRHKVKCVIEGINGFKIVFAETEHGGVCFENIGVFGAMA